MKKKIIIGVIGFFVLVGIIGAATGGSKKEGTTSPSNTTTGTSQQNQQEQQQNEPAIAKVGEAVVDSDLAFTVTSIDTASTLGNQFTQKKAQGTFYIVNMKIENKGKETKTVDSSMISLTDSQGRKFDRSTEGQTAKGLSEGGLDLFLQQIQPSLAVNGAVVFDLPADATGLTLVVKGSVFSGGQKIDLVK